VEVGVQHLHVWAELQVLRGGVSRAAHVEAQRDRLLGVHPDQQVLEVQDDVGHVLLDARQGGELVQRLVEAQLGHGAAGDGRQEGAAKRVAQRRAEARVEGADGEALAVVLLLVEGLDGRPLGDQHGGAPVTRGVVAIGVGYGRFEASGYFE
jgi:hypothetical protein